MPKENLLGSPEIEPKGGFAGVMQTFDNTRPLVAGMAIGVARACLERTRELLAEAGDRDRLRRSRPTLRAPRPPSSSRWSPTGRPHGCSRCRRPGWPTTASPTRCRPRWPRRRRAATGTDIALRCVALCGSVGYGEGELLEKWARDAKILDIFEGTQQIQLLIISRLLLQKTSAELK